MSNTDFLFSSSESESDESSDGIISARPAKRARPSEEEDARNSRRENFWEAIQGRSVSQTAEWSMTIREVLKLFDAGLKRRQLREVTIISAACGMISEALALRQLNIEVKILLASDTKPDALQFALSHPHLATRIAHFFETIDDQLRHQNCLLHHDGDCQGPRQHPRGDNVERPDCFVMGFPCQSFSRTRPGRFRDDRARNDAVLWGRRLRRVMAELRPYVCVVENVTGFAMALSYTDPTKAEEAFLAECGCENLGYRMLKFPLDAKIWHGLPRPRPASQLSLCMVLQSAFISSS
jgi:hypothetical protein